MPVITYCTLYKNIHKNVHKIINKEKKTKKLLDSKFRF